MDKVNAKLGTDYKLFNYYGAPDADRVIIAMGSINDVAEEVIDYLNAQGEQGRPGQGAVCTVRSCEKLIKPPSPPPQRRSRARPHQGAGLQGEPLYWMSSPLWPTPASRRPDCRRPLRPGLQGYASRERVRRVFELNKAEPKRRHSPSASWTM
jgi:hypothetical protein